MLRRTCVVAAALMFVVAVPSVEARSLRSTYTSLHKRVAHELGKRAAGRQIAAHGVRTKHGARKARPHDLAKSVRVLRRMLQPPTSVRSQTLGSAAPSTSSSSTPAGLNAIAQCESGGDPTAVDPTGTYRGKYQFDAQTWGSVGGSGDPAAASEAEQDKRAAILQKQRGNAPWPVCGR